MGETLSVEPEVDRPPSWLWAYRLAEARRNRNLTRDDVAQAMGLSAGTVQEIERGLLGESEVETLVRYAEALGGTLRLLVDFGDDLVQIT